MKITIILFVVIPFLTFAQWNYVNLSKEIGVYAKGG
jgi:hypothetical protein